MESSFSSAGAEAPGTLLIEPRITANEAAADPRLMTTAPVIIRWILHGKRGVHLEGVKDPRDHKWRTSTAAIGRFLALLGQPSRLGMLLPALL